MENTRDKNSNLEESGVCDEGGFGRYWKKPDQNNITPNTSSSLTRDIRDVLIISGIVASIYGLAYLATYYGN